MTKLTSINMPCSKSEFIFNLKFLREILYFGVLSNEKSNLSVEDILYLKSFTYMYVSGYIKLYLGSTSRWIFYFLEKLSLLALGTTHRARTSPDLASPHRRNNDRLYNRVGLNLTTLSHIFFLASTVARMKSKPTITIGPAGVRNLSKNPRWFNVAQEVTDLKRSWPDPPPGALIFFSLCSFDHGFRIRFAT